MNTVNPVELVERTLRALPDVGAHVYAVEAPGNRLPCVVYTYNGDALKETIGKVSQRRRTLAFEITAIARTPPEAYKLGDAILKALDATGRADAGGYSGPYLGSLEFNATPNVASTGVIYTSRSNFHIFY